MRTIATKAHKQLNSMNLGLGVDDRSERRTNFQAYSVAIARKILACFEVTC